MGRHGGAVQRRPVPWELLGWGGFACLVGAASVVWATGSWGTALLVVAAGVLGVGAMAVMSWLTPRRRRRGPVHRPAAREGRPPTSP